MAKSLAVIHHDLMSKGGGEAVAMAVLEALQAEYDITLITLRDPDLEELNAYYNTSVHSVSVEIAGTIAPHLHEQFGIKYYVLQNALLGRYAQRHADEYDYLVSTINELGLEDNAIQYIHFPFDWTVSCSHREEIFHPTIEEDSLYEQVATFIAGVDRTDIQSNALLANSEWTADVVEDAYGTRPRVLYPPVDTGPFDRRPWGEREPGFVTVGRIERSKQISELIEIVDGVREYGHETHLHVIGPTVDEAYYDQVASMADKRDYIELEGEVPRKELVDRICSHRYGIHGKKCEHFGMSVAELTAGGCVTFVPASGGQREIIGDREELLYESVDDAVEKANTVLSRNGPPADLRLNQGEIQRRFGRERFQQEIRSLVANEIERLRPSQSGTLSRAGTD